MRLVSPPRVFLSYARKDGEEFATALRRRLGTEEPEITVWQDRAQMEGGVGWWTQIEAALDQVKFLVIVMTPHAMASETTRQEWRYARQRGVLVYPVKAVPDEQLNYTALPNWMRKAHFFDIGRFTDEEWRDAKEWQTFVSYLKSDRQPTRVPFMAPDLPHGFVPRDREFEQLLHLVLDPAREHPVAITTALQGAGGYGKTTLAMALCHDERVIDAFDDGILWTSLGQSPRLVDEFAKLYEPLTGQQPAFIDVTHAAARLAEKLEHRNCLLVIDDVWETAHLEPFLRGGKHCARLVTSRRADLLSYAVRVRVDEMSAAESIRLLGRSFQPGTVSDARLAPVARRLGDWPLLLKLATGMIQKRLDRGDSADGALAYVVRALDKRGVIAFDQGDAVHRDAAVRNTLAASLDQLSAEDRRRVQELAIFPEEIAIPLTTLERLWGLDEVDTADCAQRLDDVALLRLDLRRGLVTLHDVMRAYLEHELDDPARVHARLVAGYGDLRQLPDAYAWRWLPYHLYHAGQVDELRELLLRPEWLHAKLRAVDPNALIADFDMVPSDHDLAMVQGALRLALPALVRDANQMCEQLLGRLPLGLSERLNAFRADLIRAAPHPRLHARWPNLQGPGGGLFKTLVGHQGGVNGALPLPDGRALSWSGDGTLRVWDLTTDVGRALTGHHGEVNGAVPLPDGRALSWSNDRTLRVWDLGGGAARVLTGHKDWVRGALLLPDGRALSWSNDRTLRVWDLATGEGRALTGHQESVSGAMLLPDGRALSWSGDSTLRVWDLATGEAIVLSGHIGGANGALLLPDGRALSWSDDHRLRLWDLATGEGRKLIGHLGSVNGALLLPAARALSWSDDATLRVWDLTTGEGRVLTGHQGPVSGALLLPDGQVLSWSGDRTLRVWDLETGESRALTSHQESVRGVLLLPHGRALSWSDAVTLRVWNLAMGDGRALRGHEGSVNGALPLPNGGVLSWSGDGTLRAWDLSTDAGRALTGHQDCVRGALLLPDAAALSWSGDGTLRVWDLATGEGRTLTGHEDWVRGALLLPDGRPLSWSDDGTLRVWDLATGKGRTLIGHRGWVRGALLLADGRALSWGGDRTLRVWDLATGKGRELTGHLRSVTGALQLPNGRALSWSGDRTVRVWDLATGEGRALTGHESGVIGALLLPDGRALSWSDDATLRVWDLATGEGRTLTGHEDWIRGALLLPDGRALSWSDDATLWVWNLATAEGSPLMGHGLPIRGMLLLSNGRVLSWGLDDTVWVWDLSTGDRRALTGHEGRVTGALLLPDGRALSWSVDRSICIRDANADSSGLAFYFDARPMVVLATGADGFLVGDILGRIHFLHTLDAP